MQLRWATPFLLVLALVALVPAASSAQGTTQTQQPRARPAGGLGQNYPNPFNPATRIPFAVGDPVTCEREPNRQYRVTLKVYNLLAQQVAVPIVQGTGQAIENLLLPCSDQPYVAYWDGKYQGTDREVASGIYIARLEIDGRLAPGGVRKMLVTK